MHAKPINGMKTKALALLVVGLLAATAGCQGDGGGNGAEESPAKVVRSPFTGARAEPRAVLAVKVDNAPAARPHTGIDRADIVYVEQVEGGLSRLMAVFSTQLPPSVGPVRSARETDLDVLRQFGKPALAYSGVQSKLQPAIDAAPLFPLPPGAAPDAYTRSSDRSAPYNLYVRPETALRAAPEASKARDIGFTFGAAPDEGGRPENAYTVRYPSASFSFTWSQERKRWLVSMDGAPARTAAGDRLGAATVVVQKVEITSSSYRDRWGSVSPLTQTTGSGTAVVLRDGKAYDARWERPDAEDGTKFTDGDGHRVPFSTGPVWVVYTAR